MFLRIKNSQQNLKYFGRVILRKQGNNMLERHLQRLLKKQKAVKSSVGAMRMQNYAKEKIGLKNIR